MPFLRFGTRIVSQTQTVSCGFIRTIKTHTPPIPPSRSKDFIAKSFKEQPKITILRDTRNFVVANKPPQIFSQPPNDAAYGTISASFNEMVPCLVKQYPDSLKFIKSVHRLDFPTTGAMIFAKNKTAARSFTVNFRDGGKKGFPTVKRYVAVITKHKPPKKIGFHLKWHHAVNKESGTMEHPLEGRHAITEFIIPKLPEELSKYYDERNLEVIVFQLQTGRKHQIRRHLQIHFRSTIVNDVRYGNENVDPSTHQIALHSAYLNITVGRQETNVFAPVEYGREIWGPIVDQQTGEFVPEVHDVLEKFDKGEEYSCRPIHQLETRREANMLAKTVRKKFEKKLRSYQEKLDPRNHFEQMADVYKNTTDAESMDSVLQRLESHAEEIDSAISTELPKEQVEFEDDPFKMHEKIDELVNTPNIISVPFRLNRNHEKYSIIAPLPTNYKVPKSAQESG